MRERRAELEAIHDLKVNSRWLEEKANPNSSIHDFEPSGYLGPAIDDVEDIRACDAFVLFSIDGEIATKRGGRHWETGFAYGIGKSVIVCGPKENIFHFLPDVKVCATFEETKQELLKLRYERSKQQLNYEVYGTATSSGRL